MNKTPLIPHQVECDIAGHTTACSTTTPTWQEEEPEAFRGIWDSEKFQEARSFQLSPYTLQLPSIKASSIKAEVTTIKGPITPFQTTRSVLVGGGPYPGSKPKDSTFPELGTQSLLGNSRWVVYYNTVP